MNDVTLCKSCVRLLAYSLITFIQVLKFTYKHSAKGGQLKIEK